MRKISKKYARLVDALIYGGLFIGIGSIFLSWFALALFGVLAMLYGRLLNTKLMICPYCGAWNRSGRTFSWRKHPGPWYCPSCGEKLEYDDT